MALGKLKCDTIENEGGSSITVASLVNLDSDKAPKASPTFTGTVTLPATTALAGQASDVTIIDNNAAALEIKEGSNAYMTFDTTDSSEKVSVQKAFDCDSTLNVDGVSTMNDHLNLTAQKELRLQDASGGQYVALKSPATVASNVTLTLPADDGDADEVLTTNGSGTLSWAAPVGGKVLQVVETAVRGRTSYNSAGYVDTGLNVTITPSATSSKILIIVNAQMGGPNGGYQAHSQLYRHVSGGSEVAIADGSGGSTANMTHYVMTYTSYGQYPAYPINAQTLDTPSTTSAITYKYKIKPQSQTWYFSGTGPGTSISTHSSIVAMEIAG